MAGGDSALGSSLIGMSAAAASSAATALGVSAHTYHHSMMSPYSTAAAGYGCNMTSGKERQSNKCFRHQEGKFLGIILTFWISLQWTLEPKTQPYVPIACSMSTRTLKNWGFSRKSYVGNTNTYSSVLNNRPITLGPDYLHTSPLPVLKESRESGPNVTGLLLSTLE